MLGRTNTGGGGSGGLNFQVIGGTTAPSNPKENTIWVNTSKTITDWVFSATQPSNPSNGMVWISTGTSSAVEFNALKKNGIQVYPLAAKQYIGGAWVDVIVQIYIGGIWVELEQWDGILYDSGNTCSEHTGGWAASSGTLNFFDDYMSILGGTLSTNEKIDLTNYDTLHALTMFTGTGYQNSMIGYGTTITDMASYTTNTQGNVKEEITVDISSETGEHYILASNNTGTKATYIYKIWLT